MKKHIIFSIAMVMTLSLTSCGDSVKKAEIITENFSGVSQPDNSDKEDVVITIALAVEPEPGEFDEINSADNGYRIEYVASHSNMDGNGDPMVYTDEELAQMDFALIQRIINEGDIDIVGAFSFSNTAYYEILKNKGAFVDLYEFMKDDPEVNPELLNKHILELCEIDGHLYGLPSSYQIHTMAGKTEYVGNKVNWSIDEFIEHWNNMPDNATISGSRDAENVYYAILRPNLNAFVDYKKAEVYFDSPDFRKLLEFCKRFASNNGQKAEPDYIAPNFMFPYNVYGFMSSIIGTNDPITGAPSMYHLRDGEYTLVGHPSSDGQGAYISTNGEYSICAHSSAEKQRASWEYIRQFRTEEYQQDHVVQRYENYIDGEKVISYSLENGFCINNNARKTTAERVCNGEYSNPTYENKGEVYETVLPTMEDCEFIESYVDSINRLDTEIDRQLWLIVQEEVAAYLGGGQDIDSTIEYIQNRASIMVSEKQ